MGFSPQEQWYLDAVARGMIEDTPPAVHTNVHKDVGKIPATEKDFQAEVVRYAKERGYRVYHTYDSRKSAAGFPDLVLVRERVVWAELKAENGRLTAAQENWIEWLREAGQEVYVWRPSDWPEIRRVLQ